MKDSIKLVITEEFLSLVKYFCRKIDQVEWSGMLFYDITGSIKEIEGMVITPRTIFLRDIGNHSTTGYDYDEECMNFVEKHDLFEAKHGMIHSHHSMKVWFSNVDLDELQDNVANHNLYLSLIVNNYMEMDARVVFLAQPTYYSCPDENGNEYDLEVGKLSKVMMAYPCNIIKPVDNYTVPEDVATNFAQVAEKHRKREAIKAAERHRQMQQAVQQQQGQGLNRGPAPIPSPARDVRGMFEEEIRQERGGVFNVITEDFEEEDVEGPYDDFFAYALNGGAHSQFDLQSTIEDIDENHTGDIVVDMVIKNYATYYEGFFEGDSDPNQFKGVLNEFLDVCNEHRQEYQWLTPLGIGLTLILTKFEQLSITNQ